MPPFDWPLVNIDSVSADLVRCRYYRAIVILAQRIHTKSRKFLCLPSLNMSTQ